MVLIPASAIAALTFPGVIVHGLVHQLLCRCIRLPVYEVCYFRIGHPSGYVVHGLAERWTHQFLMAAGPFLLNTALGAALAFPSVLRASEFDGASSPLDIILIWLGVSIAMHAIPSAANTGAMWRFVSNKKVPILAKVGMAPLVALIILLTVGSVFGLDVIFGMAVCVVIPKILVISMA